MGRGLLLIISGLVFVFGLVQYSVNKRQYAVAERSANYGEEQQARNIASSIAEKGIEEFFGDATWREKGKTYKNYLGGEGTLETMDAGTDQITIHSEGTYGTVGAYEINVRLQKRAFSYYAYFSEFEPLIYFATGDVIRGPLHSNSTMYVAGNPVFQGKVTSTEDMRIWGNPDFQKGFEKIKDPIPLPKNLKEIEFASKNGGLRFNDNIKVTFDKNDGEKNNDGRVTVQEEIGKSGKWRTPVTYNLADYNGSIFTNGEVYMKGELDGKVTVHAKKDIKIMGDLTYAVDPRDTTATMPADDMLGIISEKDVRVDNKAHLDNGSEDVNIHGSIMALGKSFQVDDYNKNSKKGQLNLLGGIQQETRGPVGTGYRNSSGELIIQTGYLKNYVYDDRFLKGSPPYFPTLDETFEIVYWEEINNTYKNIAQSNSK